MSAVEELTDAAGFSYLASPYTHKDPGVRHSRFKEAEACMGWLQRNRIFTISPIVACHELAYQQSLPFDAEYWSAWNSRLFFVCNRLLVLYLPGLDESKGVAQERKWAEAMKMPQYLITPTEQSYRIERV